MQPWNKINLKGLAVVLTAAVFTFIIIMGLSWFVAAGKALWTIPFTLIAAFYGIYSFVKKYYPDERY